MLHRIRRTVFALSACLGLLVAGTAQAQTYNASFEDRVIALVNDIRLTNGLPTLLEDEDLRAAALAHSLDMASTPCFQHDSCDGGSWADRIFSHYPAAAGIGENIAAGFSTPESVVDAWMNSTGHRDNILRPDWQGIGVGYVFLASAPFDHYWTQDFGTLAPVPEPESWAMLLGGLGLLGWRSRRRTA